jgi:hypothetical protein
MKNEEIKAHQEGENTVSGVMRNNELDFYGYYKPTFNSGRTKDAIWSSKGPYMH